MRTLWYIAASLAAGLVAGALIVWLPRATTGRPSAAAPPLLVAFPPLELERAGAPWMKPWVWRIGSAGIERFVLDATEGGGLSIAAHPAKPLVAFVRNDDVYVLDLRTGSPRELRVTTSARGYDSRYAGIYSSPSGWAPDGLTLVYQTNHYDLEGHAITEGDGIAPRPPYEQFPTDYGTFAFNLDTETRVALAGVDSADSLILVMHGGELVATNLAAADLELRLLSLDRSSTQEVTIPVGSRVAASVRRSVVALHQWDAIEVRDLVRGESVATYSLPRKGRTRVEEVAASMTGRIAYTVTDDPLHHAQSQGRPWNEELWIDGRLVMTTPNGCEVPTWVDDDRLALVQCARKGFPPSLRIIDTKTAKVLQVDNPPLEVPASVSELVNRRSGYAAYEHSTTDEPLWLLITCVGSSSCEVQAFTNDRVIGGKMTGGWTDDALTVAIREPGGHVALEVVEEIAFTNAGTSIEVTERQLIPSSQGSARDFREVKFKGTLVDCDAMPVCKTLRVTKSRAQPP